METEIDRLLNDVKRLRSALESIMAVADANNDGVIYRIAEEALEANR